jgi:3alpha(or 20beta)-hydroxysteroid dehydrogenase
MVDRSKRAIVTGAGGVIGKACCRQLLEDGYRVLAVDIDKEAGAALLDELGGGDSLVFESADVTNEADVEGYVRRAFDLGDGIDGFFNNAGIEGTVAPIVSMPVEIFDNVVAVNLRGVFLGLKHVMPAMAAGGGGSVVNTASVAGLVGAPGIAPYVATKHGVVGLTKVAALEGAANGIRVNAVCPGPVESRMMGSLEDGLVAMLGLADAATAHLAVASTIPGRRYAKAEEVARLGAYLLSDDSSYISGAAIPIDWGSTAQ